MASHLEGNGAVFSKILPVCPWVKTFALRVRLHRAVVGRLPFGDAGLAEKASRRAKRGGGFPRMGRLGTASCIWPEGLFSPEGGSALSAFRF